MSKLKVLGFAAAFALSAGTYAASPANAFPAPNSTPPVLAAGNPAVQNVAWVYVKTKHGQRYRARRAGFTYYYGGYWYAKPWWRSGVVAQLGPVVIYDAKVHGPRYKKKRAGWVYHNGYWYKTRWW